MKLLYKFLIALLAGSLVPLVIYSVIVTGTTGNALKSVINRNNRNTLDNAAREVNGYFAAVESKLNIGRAMERNKAMGLGEKIRLVLGESVSGDMLAGIYLLDDRFAVITGVAPGDDGQGMPVDIQLAEKASKSRQVELSGIHYSPDGEPLYDVVYPADTLPRQYVYYRFRLEYLMKQLRPLVMSGDNSQGRDILLIDSEGVAAAALAEKAPEPLASGERAALEEKAKGEAFVSKGILTLAVPSRGPGWLIVFRQPSSKAYATITRMQALFGVLILVTMGGLLLLALWLARNLSRPIESIIAGMEIVAGGNMDFKMPAVSTDELSRVVTIFNDMTSRLVALQDEMKKKERLSAIGQMANILGHEIRNPLSAISGSVFLIKRQTTRIPGTEILLKPIAIIEKEIDSTNKIISDMLDFSRQRPPVLSELDLGEVVRGIMEGSPIPENVSLNIISADVPKVWIDVEEMKQVIRNLVNNAVDSMAGKQNASLKIIIGKCALTRQGAGVSLSITDTGCGMPPDVAAKIFEPFYSTKSKGTGLGLAVVRRIVEERHCGVIEIKSVVGEGTTMVIKLPVKKPT